VSRCVLVEGFLNPAGVERPRREVKIADMVPSILPAGEAIPDIRISDERQGVTGASDTRGMCA
jgi:hypothetical protein